MLFRLSDGEREIAIWDGYYINIVYIRLIIIVKMYKGIILHTRLHTPLHIQYTSTQYLT